MLPIVLAAGYLPFVFLGGPLWGSLGIYASTWEFNSPLFYLLGQIFEDGYMTRKAVGAFFAVFAVLIALRRQPLMRAGFILMAAFILMTPTLHPWYVLWLIPFLVFDPQPEWIGFSLVVVLAYEVLIDYRLSGVWAESFWVIGVEFGVLLMTALVVNLHQKTQKRRMS